MNRRPPVARVGEYHVLDFLGAGGMGEVFRAVHSRSGQVAAIKFLTGNDALPPKAREKWRNRFMNEARVQESLRHPNLAAFYEWHEVGGTPCIVMEFVDGYTLNERLQQGAMSWMEAVLVFKRVVEAVAFMHSRGVIHRDIKSGNIKINARGEVKLLDFGIAKTNEMERLTATGAFVGTLQYLSPEQIKGKEADARCDVWALGALFYEMLSGSPPFEAPTWGELIEKVTRAHFEPLATRCSNLPRGLDGVVRRCLQKQPDARFADASALLTTLQTLEKSEFKDAKSDPSHPIKKISFVPFYVAGGLGVVVLTMWLLWPVPSPVVTPTPLAPTNLPIATQVASTPLASTPLAQPVENGPDTKIITIDVFEGASETQIYRNNQFVGHPPCQMSARLGEQIDVRLMRPGYITREEPITVTQSRSNYSFSLDPA